MKKLNLKKVQKTLCATLESIHLNFEYLIKDGSLHALGSLHLKPHDDTIFASISFSEHGDGSFIFRFDYLPKTEETLSLVNEFNSIAPLFVAKITTENQLRLAHEVASITEKQIAEYTMRVFGALVLDSTKNALLPLTKITERKEQAAR